MRAALVLVACLRSHSRRDFIDYTKYLDRPDVWAELERRGEPGWSWEMADELYQF